MRLRAFALLLLVVACDDRPRGNAPEQLLQRGRLAIQHGAYDEATTIAAEGLRRFPNDPRWRESFAILSADVKVRLGDAPGALKTLDTAPHSDSAEAAVRRLMTRGFAQFVAGDLDAAEKSYAAADVLAARTMPALRPEIALLRIAQPFRQGEWSRAEQFAREAIDGSRVRGQRYVLANSTAMLATIEMNRREWEHALTGFEEAARLARSVDARSTLVKIKGNIGWCYFNLGDLDAAAAAFSAAEQFAEQHGIVREQPTWLANLANVHMTRGELGEALPYARRAVLAARRLGDKRRIASALTNLATVCVERREYRDAARANAEARVSGTDSLLVALNDARIAAGEGEQDVALAKLCSVIDDACDPPLRWQAEVAAAHVYRARGDETDAARMYESALETGDLARGEFSTDLYLFAFETNLLRFYDEYIDLLLASGETERALAVAERSRARTLREGIGLLRRGEIGEASIAPAELAHRTNAVILSYWLGSERSLLWIATARGVVCRELPMQARIDRSVDDYARELAGSRHTLQSPRGRALYDVLVAPAESLLPRNARVVIVPHGRLTALNFETLITPRSHYWIEEATVSYAPSLQLLASREEHAARKALLVIGNVPAAGGQFPALARAGDEMERVAGHFDDRVVLAGAHATPQAYLASQPARFAFLHFVAHGTASEHTPLDSAVVLARGRLSAGDVISSPLDAELVTVSSCNSAGKRAYAGEGLVGLSWAFMRAGAKRVVAALWEVDDRATPQLMDAMYGQLAKGADPASALRDAKLKLLRSGTIYAKPWYWAPFILYGNV